MPCNLQLYVVETVTGFSRSGGFGGWGDGHVGGGDRRVTATVYVVDLFRFCDVTFTATVVVAPAVRVTWEPVVLVPSAADVHARGADSERRCDSCL